MAGYTSIMSTDLNVLSSTRVTEEESTVLNLREIWYTNMLLLGFNPLAAEKKHKIQFNRDMFSVPPQKLGMEVVLHFLFSQLNSQLCYEEFRECWPVYDHKQDQLFRKKSANWITGIAKEEPNSGLPRIVAPLLLSPGGDKFYAFLYTFSTYCLWKVTLRESKELGSDVTLPSSLYSLNSVSPVFKDINEECTSLHIIKECNHFLSIQEELSYLHNEWRQYSRELTVRYRRLCKEKIQLENKLREFLKKDTKSGASSSQLKLSPRESNKQKVRLLWKRVESFIESSEKERTVMETVLNSNSTNRHCVNGRELLDIKIPRGLVNQKMKLTDEKENINLTELIKVCVLGVKQLHQHIDKGPPLPDLSLEIDFAAKELRSHTNHVISAQQLMTVLSKHNDVLQERIKSLENELKELRRTHSAPPTISSMILPTSDAPPPTPPTPSANIEDDIKLYPLNYPVVNMTTATPTSTPYQPIISSIGASTPNYIENITKSILRKARLEATPTTRKTLRFTPNSSGTAPMVRKVGVATKKQTDDRKTMLTSDKRKPDKPVTKTSQTSCNLSSGKGRGRGGRPTKEKMIIPPPSVSPSPISPSAVSSPPVSSPSPVSPTDLIADQIVNAVLLDTSNKAGPVNDDSIAFQSHDCIGRTPVHSSIQKLKPLMTPLSDSNWLSKETPPTPYCEFVSSEGSDDNSLSPPPLIDL